MQQFTQFLLAQTVIENNGFTNPNNILTGNNQFATSNANAGSSSSITVGNFLTNIPVGALITGISFKVVGKRGQQTVPPITLQFDALDNTGGSDVFYPYTAPFTGLTTTNQEHLFGGFNYLFATTWTANKINNIKLKITANGDVSLDTVLLAVDYTLVTPPAPPAPPTSQCIDCDSPIQVQKMTLALPFLSGQTAFYLTKGSFTYPDGTPVQPGDLGSCGGKIPFVFDEGKRKNNGQNFEENAMLDTSLGYWQVLPSGIIEVELGVVTQRGLKFHTPGDHDANLMSDHDANSSVIISNNTPYNLTLVRRCQAGTVFSAPLIVDDEGIEITPSARKLNFLGGGVVAQASPSGDGVTDNVDIIIPGAGGTLPPTIVFKSFGTTGNSTATSLSWLHTTLGVDRLLTVDVLTQEDETISSVEFNAVPLTLLGDVTRVSGNLRLARYYLIAPPLGTYPITITTSGSAYISGGARSFAQVDQVSPFDGTLVTNDDNSNAVSENITTSVFGSTIIDAVGTAVQPVAQTAGAGQAVDFTQTAGLQRQITGTSKFTGTPIVETNTFTIAPATDWVYLAGSVRGLTTSVGASLEVEDEGIVVDSAVTKMNFVGGGVTVTQTAPGEVEVDVPGGGGGIDLETNGTPNGDQTLLNLIAGTGMTIIDDGLGGITFNSSGGGGYTSGSSWQSPDSPNSANVSLVAENIDDTTTYTVPSGKRLYITSYFSTSTNSTLRVDGIPVSGNAFQRASSGSNSIGNPVIVEAGQVVSGSQTDDLIIVGYLIDAPITSITPITQLIDSIGGDYTVPSGKIFVLLNAFSSGGASLLVTPNGGSVKTVGLGYNEASFWVFKQPIFFYEGDVIETGSLDAGINGYEVPIGVQFGGGGDSVITKIARQALTAGDPAGASSGQENSAALAGFTTGAKSALGFNIQNSNGGIVEIDTYKFAFAFTEFTTNDRKVVVFTIDPDTFQCTFGTPVDISATVTAVSAGVAKLDTDKFIVGYLDNSNSDVYGRVATVSGTTITFGTETNLYSQTTTASTLAVQSAGVTDEAVFVTTRSQSSGTIVDLDATGITVSGTTPTAGTPTNIDTFTGSTGSQFILTDEIGRRLLSADTAKYFLEYEFLDGGSTVDTVRVVAMTQSGTSMTIGTPVNVSSGGVFTVGAVFFDVDKFIIQYSESSIIRTAVVEISGTTPTVGTPISNGSSSSGLFSNGTSVWTSINGVSFQRFTVSGTTLVNSNEGVFQPVGSLGFSGIVTNNYIDGTPTGFSFIQNPGTIRASFYGQSNNFLGIVLATVNKGDFVNIQVSGEATITQDINSGSWYYIENGIFTSLVNVPPGSAGQFQMWSAVKGSGLNKIVL